MRLALVRRMGTPPASAPEAPRSDLRIGICKPRADGHATATPPGTWERPSIATTGCAPGGVTLFMPGRNRHCVCLDGTGLSFRSELSAAAEESAVPPEPPGRTR